MFVAEPECAPDFPPSSGAIVFSSTMIPSSLLLQDAQQGNKTMQQRMFEENQSLSARVLQLTAELEQAKQYSGTPISLAHAQTRVRSTCRAEQCLLLTTASRCMRLGLTVSLRCPLSSATRIESSKHSWKR